MTEAEGVIPGMFFALVVSGVFALLCAIKRARPDPWERRLAWLFGMEDVDVLVLAPAALAYLSLAMGEEEARTSRLAWDAADRTQWLPMLAKRHQHTGLMLCILCSALPFSLGMVVRLLLHFPAFVYLDSLYPVASWSLERLAFVFLCIVVAPLAVAGKACGGDLASAGGRAVETGQVELEAAGGLPKGPSKSIGLSKGMQEEMEYWREEVKRIQSETYDEYKARVTGRPRAVEEPCESVTIKYVDRHLSDYTEEELAAYTRRLYAQFSGPRTLVTLTEGCVRADISGQGLRREAGGGRDADVELAGNATAAFFPLGAGGSIMARDNVVVAAGGNVFRAVAGGGPLTWEGELPPRPVVERVFPRVV
eukprot:CAMPEP_0182870056 /NCGR_PEP_ID=MMETSP0034_2-20130328/10294_1 /TAXON_ID=156128 /ORGANISM="Nephroselmis pyriformis, Strain CCMP717" /LENGTH=365 /DNA_ID=CAMNT_0025002541 /DNA_START=104 /DNA_END=1198 /DNA_ORIENTATION=+